MATEKDKSKARVDECECCGFTTAIEEYAAHRISSKGQSKWLCDLCAGTMTGAFNEYPEQHDRDAVSVMKTICYVGNAILAKERAK